VSKRDWYLRQRSAHLCVQCSAPSNGKALCQVCGERNRKACAERYAALVKAGLCVDCLDEADAARCPLCAEAYREASRARWKANRVTLGRYACGECGERGHNARTCDRRAA
jgi:hypothetical protein